MEDYTNLGPVEKALCRFLIGLPILLEIDEVCSILGLSEAEFHALATAEGIDTDEDCVMRDDIKKLLLKKHGD